MINRQWILLRRPQGRCVAEDFQLREEAFEAPALAEGEILVRNMAFLCAPTIRNWMDGLEGGLIPSIPLGEPLRGPCASQVIASAHPDFPVGSRVCTTSNWQDYAVLDPASVLVRLIPDGCSYVDALGPLGLNVLTAFFGLREVGRPKPGETLLVSGAAGSVGSSVAQIGKIMGCRVIGIAGGKDKCDWLRETGSVDHCIDYKDGNIAGQIAAQCPGGIDVYFDNVGGETLQAAVDNIARNGRIVLCGQISGYNDGGVNTTIGNLMRLVYGSVRMEGFLASNYRDKFPEAMALLAEWIKEGRLVHRVDLRTGLEVLPLTMNALFDGSNRGTLIVQIDEGASETG